MLQNNMYVRLNMPDLEHFDPVPALTKWFSLRDRHSRCNDKAKEQDWFVGVFSDAKAKPRMLTPTNKSCSLPDDDIDDNIKSDDDDDDIDYNIVM